MIKEVELNEENFISGNGIIFIFTNVFYRE
jgi:hypothetical protein